MTTSTVVLTVVDPNTISILAQDPLPLVQIGNVQYPSTITIRQVEAGSPGAAGVGIGTRNLIASEALAAGDMVNVWINAGVPSMRQAKATTKGFAAMGFVLAAVASGQVGTMNFGAVNTSATGLIPGQQFLSLIAGKSTVTPPSGSGVVIQKVGFAYSTTEFMFQPDPNPVTLSL